MTALRQVTLATSSMALSIHKLCGILPTEKHLGAFLGPLMLGLLWLLPMGIPSEAQHALAIVSFMMIYWIFGIVDPGITALIGCFLFWFLGITPSSIAWSGFTNVTPWYIFGALLMGQAASRTGLAQNIASTLLHVIGVSPSTVLLSLIILICGFNFLMPSAMAQTATIAPLLVGITACLGGAVGSNIGKGLFLALPFSALLFNRMFLGGGISILAQGIIGEHSGEWLLWSQWFLAYCPLIIPTIFTSWLILRWLYPPEPTKRSAEISPQAEVTTEPWGWEAKKTLGWLLLAMILWMTDFFHHINPAAVGLGVALLMTIPKIGVLDARDVKAVNFSLVLFVGGTLSMANILTTTGTLDLVADALLRWGEPFFSDGITASQTLYWGGFLYHFIAGGEHTMISSLLPVLLQISDAQHYNPVVIGLLWNYSVSSYLFVYQSPVLVFSYSFGYFTAKDLFKVGFLYALLQALLLLLLVHLYWPLIGLVWSTIP